MNKTLARQQMGTESTLDARRWIVYGNERLQVPCSTHENDNAYDAYDTDPGVRNFSNRLRDAGSDQIRRGLVRSVLNTLGFDFFCFLTLDRIGDEVNRASYFSAYSPTGWPERYFAKRYFEVDPRLNFAQGMCFPYAWDIEVLRGAVARQCVNIRTEAFLRDAEQAGLRSGVSFVVARPGKQREYHLMSFSSKGCDRQWIVDHVIGQAYAIGVSFAEFMSRHDNPMDWQFLRQGITDLQRAVLRLVVDGLSDGEIAESLAISIARVEYQLRKLKRSFGTRNRVQLAYVAGTLESDR